MATKQVTAAELHGPMDRGSYTEHGSLVEIKGERYRVVHHERLQRPKNYDGHDFYEIVFKHVTTGAVNREERARGDKPFALVVKEEAA